MSGSIIYGTKMDVNCEHKFQEVLMKENIVKSILQELLKRINIKYIVFVVALLSGILLFANENWLEVLRLNGLINKHGECVGIIFIFTLSISLISIINSIYRFIKRKYKHCINKKYLLKILSETESSEYSVIKHLYDNGVGELPFNNYHVVNLCYNDIIYSKDSYYNGITFEKNFLLKTWAFTIIEQELEK